MNIVFAEDGRRARVAKPAGYDIRGELVAFPRKRTAVVKNAIAAAYLTVEQGGDAETLPERRFVVNLVKTIRHSNLRNSIDLLRTYSWFSMTGILHNRVISIMPTAPRQMRETKL